MKFDNEHLAFMVIRTGVHTCKDFNTWMTSSDEHTILTNGTDEVDFRWSDDACNQGVEIRLNGEYEGTLSWDDIYSLGGMR